MKILGRIKSIIGTWVRKLHLPDPVTDCHVYTEHGCREINGPECHYPKCDVLDEHINDTHNRIKKIPEIFVLPHSEFDRRMGEMGVNDSNVARTFKDYAFISIIGTPECLKYWLDEEDTVHYFKKNHVNVMNLEFDDIPTDQVEYHGHIFRGISEKQADKLIKFIENNIGKTFYIHCRAGFSRSQSVGRFIKLHYRDIYTERDDTLSLDRYNVDVHAKLVRAYRKFNET